MTVAAAYDVAAADPFFSIKDARDVVRGVDGGRGTCARAANTLSR